MVGRRRAAAVCGLRPDRRLDRRRRTRRPKVSLVRTTQVIWDPPPGTCGSALNAIKLHFIVGTAQLQDPAAALVLRNVVAELKANHRVATITRTTSSEGGPAINIPLSRKRTQVTAQLMESMGCRVRRSAR